jgi:phosphohistidine phosphatase
MWKSIPCHLPDDGERAKSCMVGRKLVGRRRIMQLYLVRHAVAYDQDAEKWPDDGDRPLTPKGARRFRKAARGVRELVPRVDLLLSSTLVRAWATAQILAKGAKWPAPVAFAPIEPGHAPSEVLVKLVEQASTGAIALVGHEPGMHELLAYLITGSDGLGQITFKKGSIACLEVAEGLQPGGGSLQWLVTPRVLRRLA